MDPAMAEQKPDKEGKAQKEQKDQKEQKEQKKQEERDEEDEEDEGKEEKADGEEEKESKRQEDKKEGKEEEEVDFDIDIRETTSEERKAFLTREKKGMTADDFEVLDFLGEGSYAKVVQARHKETGKVYALKVILKKHMKKVRETGHMSSKRRSIKCG